MQMKYISNTPFVPRYLYKYFSNLEHALDVLKDDKIHFEKPSTYNDVFDCSLSFSDPRTVLWIPGVLDNLKQLNWKQRQHLLSNLDSCVFSDCKTLKDGLDRMSALGLPELFIQELSSRYLNLLQNAKIDEYRISCFSEVNNSLLMWAHYGNHLRGVCLRFNTEKDPQLFSHLHKVDYSINRRNSPQSSAFLFTKSLDWSYEQEWRIIVEIEDEYLSTYSCDGLILGDNFAMGCKDKNDEYIQRIKAIVDYSRKKNMSIQSAVADPDKFQINIVDGVNAY